MAGFTKKALRKGAFFAFWAALGLPGLGSGPVRAEGVCPRLAPAQAIEVRQVLDGDTLRLADGRSVRLIGVNTPELGRDGRPDEPGARAARAALQQLLQQGTVTLVTGRQAEDRYGRRLAHLYVDGRSVEESLIQRGLGYAVAIAPNLDLADCLFAVERTARAAGSGVWADAAVLPAAALRRGGFQLLQGRVSGVFETRNSWYLELDDRVALRLDQTLVAQAGEAWLRRLQGRPLEVRGWVVDRQARGGKLKPGHQRWLISISDLRHLRPLL